MAPIVIGQAMSIDDKCTQLSQRGAQAEWSISVHMRTRDRPLGSRQIAGYALVLDGGSHVLCLSASSVLLVSARWMVPYSLAVYDTIRRRQIAGSALVLRDAPGVLSASTARVLCSPSAVALFNSS